MRFAEIVALLAVQHVLVADELAAVHRLEAMRVLAHAVRKIAGPAVADEKLQRLQRIFHRFGRCRVQRQRAQQNQG